MRALSTVLLVLAVARPAAAQYPGARGGYYADGWYLAGASATMRAVSIADGASDATWVTQKAHLISGALEWGKSDRSFGIRATRGTVPMSFEGRACVACASEVGLLNLMGTYRRAGPLFNTGLLQIVELGAGAMMWDPPVGRGGAILPTVSRQTDFAYSIAIGAGLPLGDRLEATVMYDVQQLRHPAGHLSSGVLRSSGSVGISTVRIGARWRLAAP